MRLCLQFGYGMMEHCRALLSGWGGGTVILSPRDLDEDQIRRFSSSVIAIQGTDVLLDPQFYLPHADHERLCSHSFWPSDYQTGVFWQGAALGQLLESLARLNAQIRTSAFILPGMLAKTIDDDWLNIQELIIEQALRFAPERHLMVTVALSADACRDADQIAVVLERAEKWRSHSVYLVAEHPKGQYLSEDPNWLANVIDLAAGLRLIGKSVLIGYCNQQLLIAATAKATAIASGTWMNVRSFPPEKFVMDYEEEMKQRSTWYYCPQSLSEYKVPFLDIAARRNLLGRMAPKQRYDGGHAAALFGGSQPSSVGFNEQHAFRHYLHALRAQAEDSTGANFDETVDTHRRLLDSAEVLLRVLGSAGIGGQKRDFTDIVDVNRAALELLVSLRGPILRRKWGTL